MTRHHALKAMVLFGVFLLLSCGGGDDAAPNTPVTPTLHPQSTSPSGTSGSYTPVNFYSHYAIPGTQGYNPNNQFLTGTTLSAGGYGAVIAIVDAPGSPAATVISDLAKFNAAYGLPTLTTCTSTTAGLGSGCNPSTPFITVIDFSNGSTTSSGYADWQGEIALDTQWAHAFAPRASIVLVIGSSSSNLAAAEAFAAALPNVVAVSMSYGGQEYSVETGSFYDTAYQAQIAANGVTLLAATGDSGDWGSNKNYPAASPYVTAVGGTSTSSVTGVGETAWPNGGGGPSIYEKMPSYQTNYLKSQGGASFTGSIAASSSTTTTMTVSSVSCSACYGALSVGQYVVGTNVISGTYISAFGTGTGGTGTYTLTTPTAQTTAVAAGSILTSCGGFNGSGTSNGLAGRLCTSAGLRGMPDVSANADPGTAGQFTASISGSTMTVTSVTSGSNISPGMALINASSLTYLSRGSSYLVIVGTAGTTKAGATGTYTVMTASCLSTLLSSNPTPTASLMASTASTCMTGTGGGGTSTFTQTATSLYGYMQSPVPYYVNGVLGYVGGTSEATPMWAGIVAQMASNYSGSFGTGIAGWKSLIKSQAGGYGFNNYLYSSGLVGSMINDVTLGTNFTIATGTTTSACAQFCTADVGWDAVTGLGSPNVTALINNLK